MSTYVIDSSYIVGWLLKDEKNSESDKIFADFQNQAIELVAPTLLQVDIANILKTNVNKGKIDRKTTLEILQRFLQLPIAYISSDVELTLQVAFKYDLNIYDATYLTLALAGQTLLLTKNEKLATAFSNSAQSVSEPSVKYQTGSLSSKASRKQFEKFYQEKDAALLNQLRKEQLGFFENYSVDQTPEKKAQTFSELLDSVTGSLHKPGMKYIPFKKARKIMYEERVKEYLKKNTSIE